VTGAKLRGLERWEQKEYWQKGDTGGLFGVQAVGNHDVCIITEGEFDAMAAYEMYGFKYACLSVAHGAPAAVADVTKHLEWIESTFKHVYICMDNDAPGDSAAIALMSIISPGKARRVVLPMDIKDANEMLERGMHQEFREAVDAAKGDVPSGFCDTKELMQAASQRRENPDFYRGVSYGYELLDFYTGGANEDEIMIFAGDTGTGKTALVRQLAYNLLQQGMKVCWFSLEMPPIRVLEQFVETHTASSYHVNGVLQLKEYEYIAAEDYLLNKKGLVLYQNFGALDPKKICDRIIHAHLAFGCKVFVIDHLAIMTSDKDWKEIDALMSQINAVAIQYHLHIMAVAQYSSTGNIRGSKGQDQIASCVLSLERDNRTTVMKITTKKPHRYAPNGYGEFYLNFNKKTRRYEDIPYKDAQNLIKAQIQDSGFETKTESYKTEGFVSRYKARVAKLADSEEPASKGELRAESSEVQPGDNVLLRTSETSVGDDSLLQTGLQLQNEEREDSVCGDEGVSETGRSYEDAASPKAKPTRGLANFIRECGQAINLST
jgi:archaellum biogenesis ATPase FlaH